MPGSAQLKSQKGFSLVELMITLTIFSVGILAVAGMQITALKSNSSSNIRGVQTDMATSILEEILTWPVTSFADATNINWVFGAGEDTVLSGGTYTATYSVDVDYNGVNNLIYVEVDVVPTFGSQRTYTATGFKRGI